MAETSREMLGVVARFRLKSVEQKEKVAVAQTIAYLNTLRVIGVHAWINEEFLGPGGRSHPLRKRGADIEGVASPNGRKLSFEGKKEKVYRFIIANWDRLKANKGNQCKEYEHYRDQIEYNEMVNRCGGVAEFFYDWKQVKDRLVKEGIDTTWRPSLDHHLKGAEGSWREVNLLDGPLGDDAEHRNDKDDETKEK